MRSRRLRSWRRVSCGRSSPRPISICAPTRYPTKAKGELPFEISPLLSDFRRPGSVHRSQLLVMSKFFGTCEQSPPFPVPRHHVSLRELSCSIRGIQFPECCVSLVSDTLADFLSDTLAGVVSGDLPSSVAGPLPNLVPDSHPEFLPRRPCELRFRFPWVPFPALLRAPLPVPCGSCPLSPSGRFLLR
jgi:hypothetical protein